MESSWIRIIKVMAGGGANNPSHLKKKKKKVTNFATNS
jgi:hypothetical protein